jgi:hypothetical protein
VRLHPAVVVDFILGMQAKYKYVTEKKNSEVV